MHRIGARAGSGRPASIERRGESGLSRTLQRDRCQASAGGVVRRLSAGAWPKPDTSLRAASLPVGSGSGQTARPEGLGIPGRGLTPKLLRGSVSGIGRRRCSPSVNGAWPKPDTSLRAASFPVGSGTGQTARPEGLGIPGRGLTPKLLRGSVSGIGRRPCLPPFSGSLAEARHLFATGRRSQRGLAPARQRRRAAWTLPAGA